MDGAIKEMLICHNNAKFDSTICIVHGVLQRENDLWEKVVAW